MEGFQPWIFNFPATFHIPPYTKSHLSPCPSRLAHRAALALRLVLRSLGEGGSSSAKRVRCVEGPGFRPLGPAPAQSHYPLRGEYFGSPHFSFGKLSGRRDLNPGPPKSTHLADGYLFDQKELSAHCTEASKLQESGITGFVGDWWRNVNYDRRRRIIANPPKPTARSERADGSGITLR